jgi:hypothetical protein
MQPHGELRATLAAFGLPQVRVANLLGVRPRHLRRWRSGERRLPHGIRILLNLVAAGIVTIDDIERAVASRANGGAELGPVTSDLNLPAVDVDPDSVAGKVIALGPTECRWPVGDPVGNPEDVLAFRFCGRPIVTGGLYLYCSDHLARAVRPRIARALKLSSSRLDQRASAPEALDREDIEILAHARARRAVPMEWWNRCSEASCRSCG